MADPSLLQTYLGIAPQTSEEAVLRLIVESGVLAVGADEGSLLVHDLESNDLRFAMVCGEEVSEAVLIGQHVPLGKGVTGLAAQTGDVHIGAPTFKDVEQSEAVGTIKAVIAAPMQLGDDLIGVITAVSNHEDKRFSSRDGEMLGSIASIAAVVVDQAQRLRAMAADGEVDDARALPPSDPLERVILERIGRLLQRDPDTVRQVAAILEALERITPDAMATR
jgi:GAF domain-containing protein